MFDIWYTYNTWEEMENDLNENLDEWKATKVEGNVYEIDGAEYNGHPGDHHFWEPFWAYVEVRM